LDKTGTVTEGRVQLIDVGPPAQARALELAAVLEREARHPLAAALRRWADAHAGPHVGPHAGPEDLGPAADVVEHPGRGIEGQVAGHRVRVGSPRWIQPREAGHRARLSALLDRGLTPVVIEVDGELAALIGLGDRLRPEAPALVDRLRSQGYALALRSGDHPRLVEAAARALGIDDAEGGLSPEDKAAEVRADPRVMMVGDGINDALALRTAAVGVAVGGGAEAALAVADVYMEQPGLGPLVELMEGARRAQAVVRRNLAFSLVYNVLFASLALAGEVTPLTAAVLMPLSSLTVVLGSLLQRCYGASKRNLLGKPMQIVRGMTPVALAKMQ
ncbi:MAG: cation-translocating P-type ATPase, partial [Myxococcales bacterium]|nr:cation-translocating P-type ATPase [Myxococcales bacterium]